MHDHPDYTNQPIADDLKREHFLHRLVAVSAFMCALCILPVAQYVLVGRSPEQGDVAGVSTTASPDQEETRANIGLDSDITATASPTTLLECVKQKDADQVDLERFATGKKKAMVKEYEEAVQPYRSAIALLQGTPAKVAEEKAALDALIDGEYQRYLSRLTEVEVAVNTSQQEILNRTCPAQ